MASYTKYPMIKAYEGSVLVSSCSSIMSVCVSICLKMESCLLCNCFCNWQIHFKCSIYISHIIRRYVMPFVVMRFQHLNFDKFLKFTTLTWSCIHIMKMSNQTYPFFFILGQFWPLCIVFAGVCVCVYLYQPFACLHDNSSPVQAGITLFGPEVQNALIKFPVVLGVDWPWKVFRVKFNLKIKFYLVFSLSMQLVFIDY